MVDQRGSWSHHRDVNVVAEVVVEERGMLEGVLQREAVQLEFSEVWFHISEHQRVINCKTVLVPVVSLQLDLNSVVFDIGVQANCQRLRDKKQLARLNILCCPVAPPPLRGRE